MVVSDSMAQSSFATSTLGKAGLETLRFIKKQGLTDHKQQKQLQCSTAAGWGLNLELSRGKIAAFTCVPVESL